MTLTCGFIGLGLIGGSIAKAIRQNNPDTKILAYDIEEASLLLSKQEGVTDEIFTSITPAFGFCDFLFLCAPISKNNDLLLLLKNWIQPNCIITDVGSVKTPIHQLIEAQSLSHCFIGGHPMAGSEKPGFANSNALLLENAYYILTPGKEVLPEKIEQFKTMVSSFGAIPLVLDYQKHDYITAAISHLPHVIAASLVNLVKESDDENGLMKLIAAGGFKDITRIASSSPIMWQQICLTNTANIRDLLTDYISSLNEMITILDQKSTDSLYHFFSDAKDYRDSFLDVASGPIKKTHDMYLDIPDQTGAIVKVATILADKNISIKNIGIMHNREFQQGALRIEFYDDFALLEATELLKTNQYTIYERN